MLHNNPGNHPDPMPPMGEPLPPPQIRRHPGAPMTDTTNHAEVIRNWMDHEGGCAHYNTDIPERCNCGYTKALTALDALTRELEETKRSLRIQADHAAELEKAEVAQSARIADLEAQGTINRDEQGRLREELRVMADGKAHAVSEATRHFNTVLAQSARIAKLEEVLAALLGASDAQSHAGLNGHAGMQLAAARSMRLAEDFARTALAPSKGERKPYPMITLCPACRAQAREGETLTHGPGCPVGAKDAKP